MPKREDKSSGKLPAAAEDTADSGPAEAGKPAAGARVTAVSSGKGGVGKSSISVNLSIALAQQGHRVCLFDADTNLANVNILMGLAPEHTLQALLQGERGIDDIMVTGPGGVCIIPAASGIAEFVHLSIQQQELLLAALRDLEQRFDYLIIDTAAGISEQVIQFLLAAPHNILIITPDPTSLTDAFSLLKVLKRYHFDHQVQVIVNQVSGLPAAHDTFKRFTGAAAKFLQLEIRYLGYVLTDRQFKESVVNQQPLLLHRPTAIASRCINAISNRLQQLTEGGIDPADGFSSFFEQQLYPQQQDSGEPAAPPVDQAVAQPLSQPPENNAQVGGLLAGVYYASLLGAREKASKG